MQIRRVIVEDSSGLCILNNPLEISCTENELRAAFAESGVCCRIFTDLVGTALVTVVGKVRK